MPRKTALLAAAGALAGASSAFAQSSNALSDPGFDGPVTEVTTWRAGVEGPGAWFGHNFAVDGGVCKLTLSATNWQGRGLLQAVPMPAAGTFRMGLDASYDDYYSQLHYWHILAAKSDASITLTYQNILYAFSNPKAVSVYKNYSRPGEEGDPWHTFDQEFTVTPQIAAQYDYLVFLVVGSMKPGQHVWLDNVVLDLSRLHDSGINLGGTTTNSIEMGSSPFVADLTGDGLPDLVMTGRYPKVYLQNASHAFSAGSIGRSNVRRQGGLADFDNDGNLDFWACNVGDWYTEGVFWDLGPTGGNYESGAELEFGEPWNNEAMMVADVDGDGWCDVVQCSENGNFVGINTPPPEDSREWKFLEADSDALGLDGVGASGNGDYLSSGDVNNDGYPDFFYHFGGGRLFLSRGDGTYAERVGAITVTTGESDKMGSAWGDYDNDGDLDLFVARLDAGQPCYLFRQNADGSFSSVASGAGVTTTAGHRSGCWGDYDNDGDLDLFIVGANGAAHTLYENNGDGTFTQSAEAFPASGDGSDAVFADYDNDGDLDLFMTNIGAAPTLLVNDTDNDRSLKVRLIGRGAGGTNLAGVGVRVELYSAGGTLLGRRDVGAMRGYGGQEPLWLHFGGVDPSAPYTLKAYFNNGVVEATVVPGSVSSTIGGTTIPRMVTLTEGEDTRLQVVEWQETDPSR